MCVPAVIYAIFVVIFAFIMYNHPLTKQSAVNRTSTAVSTLIGGLAWTYFIYYMCQRGSTTAAWGFVIVAIVAAVFMLTILPRVVPKIK